MARAAQSAPDWYDDEGGWISDTRPPHARERFWLCCALYPDGAAPLADAIIRRAKTAQTPQQWSIFDPNIAAALLVAHRDLMACDVRQKLEALVRESFGFKPGNRQPDFQFHGYNDNMPAKATLGLILGGEMLDEPDAVQYGLWNLRQLRAMLVRRGINSEWNSPTYTPLTSHALGAIAEYARNEEARELARGLEERLWLDVAARFHPTTGVLCGPYSRAYTVDTLAHLSLMASLLWFHLGEKARPSPMELFAPPSDLVLHHMKDIPFNVAQMCWLAAGHYHIPAAAWEMFDHKEFPFRAAASYELGDSGPDSPARAGYIETWMQPDFSVGTASTPYPGGTNYFATYRRRQDATSFRDVGTVFSKIVIDEAAPGIVKTPAANGSAQTAAGDYSNCGEEDYLVSYDNTLALQEAATALVLTHPHLTLGGPPDGAAGTVPQFSSIQPRAVSALSEMVIFPSHFGGADEIIVGEKPRATWSGEVAHGDWIVARRGRLLIGVRPLAYSQAWGTAPVTLGKINNYEVIRANFYRGPQRAFTRGELRHIFGGFVAEHASVDDYSSLEEFAGVLRQTKFTDYFWMTRRTRYRRPQTAGRAALEMEVSWSPGADAPRYATINGRTAETPVVQIDGLVAAQIPFLNEEFQSVPAFFPWQDFEVVWGDWPYAIGDREQ